MANDCQKFFEDANELLLNDEFQKSVESFTNAIEKSDKSDVPFLVNSYIGRSQAYLKLNKFKQALADSDLAIQLNESDSRAYLKKGIALFNLKEYKSALEALKKGQNIAGTDTKKNLFNDWINKCSKELPTESAEPVKENPKKEENETVEAKPAPVLPAAPPAIKHEWYQTESSVTVSILAKNLSSNDITIKTETKKLTVTSNNPDTLKINFDFNLANEIIPDQTQTKYLTNKVEIKLKKSEAVQWRKLEADPNTVDVKIADTASKPQYPTSSKKPKNWDKIAADVVAEEKDEKLEGDAALNKLFQQIYSNGSDEVRKAMNKSFSESGGTVLSTNWKEVAPGKVDVKAPDGMEWKKWD